MTEIRLQWKSEIVHFRDDLLLFGVWHERTAASARDLDLMVKAGEQVYGAGSHWVETRKQPENRQIERVQHRPVDPVRSTDSPAVLRRLISGMPQTHSRLTPDQKIAALAWKAACEKLDHFLRATPGYPELSTVEVAHMMDTTESALLELRRTFEERAHAMPP